MLRTNRDRRLFTFRNSLRMLLLAGAVLKCASCLTNQTIRIAVSAPSPPIETDVERVRRAIADLRTAGTALLAYAVDTNRYPTTETSEIAIGEFRFGRIDQLSSLPTAYRGSFPTFDPWGFPYLYWTDGKHSVLVCTGSDGRVDDAGRLAEVIRAALSSEWRRRPEQTHCFEDEIVVMDGHFLTWPANDTRMCRAAQQQKTPEPLLD